MLITKGMGKILVKKVLKKVKEKISAKQGKFPETESLTHQVGPYVGDVGSEGKKVKKRKKEAVGLEEVKSLLKGAGKAMSIEKQKKYIKPFTKKHKKAEKILKGEN